MNRHTFNISDSMREHIFYSVLLLFAFSLPFAVFGISVCSFLLLFQWLVTGNYNEKINRFKSEKSLWLIISIYGVYLIGMLFNKNISVGIYELKKVLFWLIIPIAIATSPKLSEKKFWLLMLVFVLSVIASSIVGGIKLVFRNYFEIIDPRELSFISHISLSLQIVFAIVLISLSLIKKTSYFSSTHPLIRFLAICWLTAFLLLQKSMVGIICYYVVLPIIILLFIRSVSNKFLRFTFIAFLVFSFCAPLMYTLNVVRQFYNTEKIDLNNLEKQTVNGNPYNHFAHDKSIENGHFVNLYICDIELENEWNRRTNGKLSDTTTTGYGIQGTLLRYLTSKGLRKDSVGISILTDRDIQNIKNGMPNYIFEKKFISIYPRIYETIWELDRYLHTGNPNDQSLSQRIEFSKAALIIIKRNFWFGIGTGNYRDVYAKTYIDMKSQLDQKVYGPAHNQYLNYMVKFGIVGFLWIYFALIYPIFERKQTNNIMILLLFLIYLIANLGDSNFETHIGLSFFVLFYSLLLWHSPSQSLKSNL